MILTGGIDIISTFAMAATWLMRHIQNGILIILTVLVGGCGTSSKVSATKVQENFKDVCVLSILIQDQLSTTDARDINLERIIQNDTLRRISANFEKIELKSHGGYIEVRYKFSASRNTKIELTKTEQQFVNRLKVIEKEFTGEYDGEIQFEYGERFYHIRRIVARRA